MRAAASFAARFLLPFKVPLLSRTHAESDGSARATGQVNVLTLTVATAPASGYTEVYAPMEQLFTEETFSIVTANLPAFDVAVTQPTVTLVVTCTD
jgi:hypothetical protein